MNKSLRDRANWRRVTGLAADFGRSRPLFRDPAPQTCALRALVSPPMTASKDSPRTSSVSCEVSTSKQSCPGCFAFVGKGRIPTQSTLLEFRGLRSLHHPDVVHVRGSL